MSKRKAKKQADTPSDDLPPKPVETPEARDLRDCLCALGLCGKGYDPSKHYIKETAEALRAWVVRHCCEDGDRLRAAGAAVDLPFSIENHATLVMAIGASK